MENVLLSEETVQNVHKNIHYIFAHLNHILQHYYVNTILVCL